MFKQLAEENMKLLVKERSGGVSEITGRPGGAIHHILGRNKPKGFKGLPEVIREWWPHIPFLCIVLTTGEHEATIKYPRVLRVLLMNFMLLKNRHWIWEGKTVEEWFSLEQFRRWL